MSEPKKILVVEDDENISEIVQRILTGEGYTVKAVFDGEAAVATHKTFQPDLVIMDVSMPLKDGITACKEIREADDRVLILMLTAQKVQVNSVVGLDAGADGYVTKPFGPKELVARVKSLFRRLEL